MMNFERAEGAPMMVAVIVLAAFLILGGISIAFQGSVQF